MSANPQARSADLVVEAIGDDLLIFDRRAERAHSLNAPAVAVWRACDGTRDVGSLAAHTGLSIDAVDLALSYLGDCGLLEGEVSDAPRVSRRAALRKAALTGAGLGVVALPVIRSIAAPSAEAANSTCGPLLGQGGTCASACQCTNNGSCCCVFGSAPTQCVPTSLCHAAGRPCMT